jgi:hypothetical protein
MHTLNLNNLASPNLQLCDNMAYLLFVCFLLVIYYSKLYRWCYVLAPYFLGLIMLYASSMCFFIILPDIYRIMQFHFN